MITYEQALTANRFEHKGHENADGTPLRVRRNGKTKTWKRQPGKFKIPVKYGIRTYLYITDEDASKWEVAP